MSDATLQCTARWFSCPSSICWETSWPEFEVMWGNCRQFGNKNIKKSLCSKLNCLCRPCDCGTEKNSLLDSLPLWSVSQARNVAWFGDVGGPCFSSWKWERINWLWFFLIVFHNNYVFIFFVGRGFNFLEKSTGRFFWSCCRAGKIEKRTSANLSKISGFLEMFRRFDKGLVDFST